MFDTHLDREHTRGWVNVCSLGNDNGADDDDTARINAAMALASSNGARTLDLRGLGKSLVVVRSTIALGAADGAPLTIVFDPSTRYVPASAALDMFLLLPGARVEGLTVDVTGMAGYSGKVMKLAGFIYDNQPGATATGRTALDDLVVYARGNVTGTGLHLESTGVGDYIQFVDFGRVTVHGMLYGVRAVASGAGWINGNIFSGVRVSNAVHGMKLEAVAGGACAGNVGVGYQYEAQVGVDPSVGLEGLWISGAAHNNWFVATRIWDVVAGGGRASLRVDAGCHGNYVQGQVDMSLVVDLSGFTRVDDTLTASSIGPVSFTAGSFTAPVVTASDPAQGFKIGSPAAQVVAGDGTHTYMKPQDAANGSVFVQTGGGAKNAIFDKNGCLTVPQSILGLSPGTDAGAGQAGRVFMGSGVPNNANGNNGDFYFRVDTPGVANQRVYNRQAGAWVGIL